MELTNAQVLGLGYFVPSHELSIVTDCEPPFLKARAEVSNDWARCALVNDPEGFLLSPGFRDCHALPFLPGKSKSFGLLEVSNDWVLHICASFELGLDASPIPQLCVRELPVLDLLATPCR